MYAPADEPPISVKNRGSLKSTNLPSSTRSMWFWS
jgi:hypothetical protein